MKFDGLTPYQAFCAAMKAIENAWFKEGGDKDPEAYQAKYRQIRSALHASYSKQEIMEAGRLYDENHP